ncbi:UNKNOWN [Stylonychia lemnae]|uniref:Uncharacterized protein n=1 Tax=Stylonychia lemnae TaxID=5949 RepID=A0A077ZVD5_STYLE|nr:UNKNOWN [Stylonychia lemnae]|eukprot:CDW73599.1 UNKNOWN [Stylonychia lemnae]
MASFMSRFGSKKTTDSPAAVQSRNHGSMGPIKANSQAVQNQQRLNTSSNLMSANIGGTGMYVIQTEIDYGNNSRKNQPKSQADLFLLKENEQLKDQVKDMETNLQINKEIIKNLLESNNQASGQNGNQTLQQVLISLQKENQHLQLQVSKLTYVGPSNMKERERITGLEKQVSEMKALILHKEQLANQKELAYNEVLQICARYAKNDQALMGKLRELKFKHAEGNGSQNNNTRTMNTQQNLTSQTMMTQGDDNTDTQGPSNLIQENQNLKKELDFATAEVERLRAKLIIDDYDMAPLSSELFGMNSKERSFKLNESMDNQSDLINSEFMNLKDQISQNPLGNQSVTQSRNIVGGSRNQTASSSFVGSQVPKLDFKRLKKVQEFKDWYTYASKLEDSVKYLRQRIKQIEEDNSQLNTKYRKEQAAKENLFGLNEKLNKALKRANLKIAEVKDKYIQKFSKKCYYCNNDMEISMNLNTTLDQVQLTEMNQSFVLANSGSGAVHEQEDGNDSFGDKLNDQEDDPNNNVNLLDNLYVEENSAQTESDKLRQQQLFSQQKVIMRGQGVKVPNQANRESNSNKLLQLEQKQILSRNLYNSVSHISAPNNINMSNSMQRLPYKIKKQEQL